MWLKKGNTQNGYGSPGYILGRIFSIEKKEEEIIFREECDGHYYQKFTKPDAMGMIEMRIAECGLRN